MKRVLCLFLISLVCLSALISGCQKNISEQENVEENIAKKLPVMGGELVVPIIRFHTLNPVVNDNQSVYFIDQLIYEGLVELDDSIKPIPVLATKWEVFQDGSELQFELRDNVTWHDGKPFTAEDVKFTIDTLKLGDNNKYKTIYSDFVQNIDEVKVLNPLKISIKLNPNSPNFIEAFTFPIIPKHVFNSREEVYSRIHSPIVGTGPFKVSKYDRYSQLELTSNLDYWREKAYIEKITAKIVPDKEAALTSVESGEVNVAQAKDYDWEKFAGDKAIRIYEFVTQEYEFLGFNFENEILNDKNIRKAIAFAIDRHKITNDIYLGHSTVTDVPIHPNSYLFNEEAQKLGYDKDKAIEYLGNSNWQNRDTDSILENEEGEELRFKLLVNDNNTERLKTAEIIADQLRTIGIEVILHSVSWEEYENLILGKDYDILLGGWQMPIIPSLKFLLHSNSLNSTNHAAYSDSVMDMFLDQASQPLSIEQKVDKYINIQEKFVEDLPYLSLFYKNSALIVKKEIKGDVAPNYYNIYKDIVDWYLEEE